MENQTVIEDVLQSEDSNCIEETEMDVEILYGGKKAKLIYSQNMLLLNSVCTLKLNGSNYSTELLGWAFNIEFTNDLYRGLSTPNIEWEHSIQSKRVNIKCYNWYGEDMENNTAIEIFSKPHLITFFVKIKTTSLLSRPEKRSVDISIWQK